MSNNTLSLGLIDAKTGMTRKKFRDFIELYHSEDVAGVEEKNFFANDAKGGTKWISFRISEANEVTELTRFLQAAGFFPNANNDGIFGYATQAAVRLFQEYVRSQEGYIGSLKLPTPDGLVGPNTRKHIERWQSGSEMPKVVWNNKGLSQESAACAEWRDKLEQVKVYLQKKEHRIVQHITDFTQKSDTLAIEGWKFPLEEPLLVGIRRGAQLRSIDARKRTDDLFVLLINGLSFVFFGSTDPKINSIREDEPYLLEGQHLYRYSWHKISDAGFTYRALRPAEHGVLIYRDFEKQQENALTEKVIAKGPSKSPNKTINIHWSGKGRSNWSKGCQVIAADEYIDQSNRLISCRKFAAWFYDALGKGGKTRGAYNLLADLLLIYGPKAKDKQAPVIRYTLFSEDTLAEAGVMSREDIDALRGRFSYHSK